MHDLTTGSVSAHLLRTTGFMLVTMVFSTLYVLVDLYWVGRLGTSAVAAVAIAGNLTFVVLAITQVLGVGTTTVISHAAGRKDHAEARLLFNQSQVLSIVAGVLFLVVGLVATGPYSRAMSADAETARQTAAYLYWFVPAMAFQFPIAAMASALRAVGLFKPGMIVSSATVLLNMVIAPFLIFGWGTGLAFGVAGAAIATLVSIIVGVVWLSRYFTGPSAYLRFDPGAWRPSAAAWKRMLSIGLPAGFEFAMMTVYMVVVYAVTRPFGAEAQAAFGIGLRIVQAGFMPVIALGFSVAPVAGQNFGAGQYERVRATFRDAALMASGAMVVLKVVCHAAPESLVSFFTRDADVVAIGAEYLRIVSWNFVASGLIFVSSSMFQAMGNTIPSLVASATRIVLTAVPIVILSRAAGFQLTWIWWISVATTLIQLGIALWFLRREFQRRLGNAIGPTLPNAVATS